MEVYREDINRDIGTLFLIVLFSLFVLIFSGKQQTSQSSNYRLQNEMAFRSIPFHPNATLVSAVTFPDWSRSQVCVSHSTGLNLFSITYLIFSYNRSTNQDIINNIKTSLRIEPLLLWRIKYLHSLSGKADPAILS